MREIFTYGSVGGAPGNRCFYPERRRRERVALTRKALAALVSSSLGFGENMNRKQQFYSECDLFLGKSSSEIKEIFFEVKEHTLALIVRFIRLRTFSP